MREKSNVGVEVIQVRGDGGCYSYILFSPTTRDAAIIDPRCDELEEYRERISEQKLKLLWILDTHTHADHYSASHVLKQEFGGTIAMGAATKSERVEQRLVDGDRLELGEASILVVAAPGHTPDSVCYHVSSSWGQGLFTGDTLLIGGSGRTDFPGASPSQQYEFLTVTLNKYSNDTYVFPGHDYSDLLFSTLGTERATNPHLNMSSMAEFVEMKQQELLDIPNAVSQMVEFNRLKNPKVPANGGACTACSSIRIETGLQSQNQIETSALAEKLKLGIEQPIFDVREPAECRFGVIPNSLNIPLSRVSALIQTAKTTSQYFVSCQMGGRSAIAAKTLLRVGLGSPVNVKGGFARWKMEGHKVTQA